MKNDVILKRSLFGFILIIAVIIGLLSFRMVNVEPSTAPLETFSAERAAIHVVAISQNPHPMGSVENEQVRDYIITELSKLGVQTEVQATKVPEYYIGDNIVVPISLAFILPDNSAAVSGLLLIISNILSFTAVVTA